MNCPKCGNPLVPNMKFCTKCGTPVPQKPTAPQQPVRPQAPAMPQQPVNKTQQTPARPKEFLQYDAPKKQPSAPQNTVKPQPPKPPVQPTYPQNNPPQAQPQPVQQNIVVQPQIPPKKKKSNKNLPLIIVAVVLVLAVLASTIAVVPGIIRNKNEINAATEYIEDFPTLKQQASLLVYDVDKFPSEKYEIKVERMFMGGVFEGKTIIEERSTEQVYNIDFEKDGDYRITLTDKTESEDQISSEDTETIEIVIIIDVKVDDDDPEAVGNASLDSVPDDRISEEDDETKSDFIEATQEDFVALGNQIDAPETISTYGVHAGILEFDCKKNSAEWVMDNLIFNCHFGGYTYFFSDNKRVEGKDPLGKYYDSHFKVPENDIKWICENIYNVKYEPIAENTEFKDWGGYLSDGYYYYSNPAYGDGVYAKSEVADYKIVNNKYEIIVNGYTCYEEDRILDRACKVTAEIKIIDGKRYWSIYKIEECEPNTKLSTQTETVTTTTTTTAKVENDIEVYKPVLDMYLRTISNDWADVDYENDDSVTDPDSIEYLLRPTFSHNSLSTIGYALIDIDGNGQKELFISTSDLSKDGNFLSVYTIVDGKIVLGYIGNERNLLSLNEDNSITHYSHGGHLTFSYTNMALDMNKKYKNHPYSDGFTNFKTVKVIACDGTTEERWFCYDESMSGEYSEENRKSVSADEAKKLIDTLPKSKSFKITSFSEYNS